MHFLKLFFVFVLFGGVLLVLEIELLVFALNYIPGSFLFSILRQDPA